MAKEARKLKRAGERDPAEAKAKKRALKQPMAVKSGEIPDPLGPEQLKSLLFRLGIPVAGVWVVGLLIAGFTLSTTWQAIGIGIPVVATLAAAGLVWWSLRQAKKARSVAGLLQGVESAEDRKAALEELDRTYKKNDPAAVFAKAQLEMQEDPDRALQTLEQIDLNKVMAPVADEARAQRAMIHLMKGQVSLARQLVDNIDLKRHQDARSRAMMASVVGEAWARSGQAKKALEVLELYDPEDELYLQVRPQLWRAYAFAYAYTSRQKDMRRALRKLLEQDARLLGAFLIKKTHPLLQKESRKLLEQSGAVPRKMMVQRR